jgi:hypothetical protein
MLLRRWRVVLMAAAGGFLFAQSAQALIPHQTFYFQGVPPLEQIQAWSSLPGTRSYLFDVSEPTSTELELIGRLRGADRLQIEVARFPGEDSLPAWTRLAAQGVDFIGLGSGLPTEDEVRRLNEARFSHLLFAMSYFPGIEDASRLKALKASVSLTFVTRAYPRYDDKPGLLAIPPAIPLLFVTDYWPMYTHMDVLNLLPQPRRLRVSGMMPPEESLPYLRHIDRLMGVEVETYDDPGAGEWKKMEGLPLGWTSKGHVPSSEALQSFSENGGRKLVIDQDAALTPQELQRLESSPLAVEWVHTAPSLNLAAPGRAP